jgi:hypothetical protein
LSALQSALADARRQWAANRRLRIGVVAIAAIVVLYLFLVLQDWRAALATEYAARTEHLYKMRALAGQDEWIERARSMAEVRRGLEAELPDAATPGLAQANVQGWARDVVAAYGDEDVTVQVRDAVPVEGHPGVWRVPVAINGPLRAGKYLDLVASIERRNTLAVIEQARVMDRENKTFALTVVAYFRIAQAGEAGDAGA